MSTTTLGIVLAAGSGQRYGKPKVTAADGHWLECAVMPRRPMLMSRHIPSLQVECSDLASGEDIDEE